MTVQINLKRDLPKVRKHWRQVMTAKEAKRCDYTAPCVIGAMVTPRKRKDLEYSSATDVTTISALVEAGEVRVPKDQLADVYALQHAFDYKTKREFQRLLRQVERKYLPAPEAQS